MIPDDCKDITEYIKEELFQQHPVLKQIRATAKQMSISDHYESFDFGNYEPGNKDMVLMYDELMAWMDSEIQEVSFAIPDDSRFDSKRDFCRSVKEQAKRNEGIMIWARKL